MHAMKKRLAVGLLALALLAALVPTQRARAEELTFLSINEVLPPELINCVVTYGGLTYVPYYVFSNYGIGISYTYFSSASTAYLYSGEKQLFFEMSGGDTYDGENNHYSGSAIVRGGTVYLPLNLMYRFFGNFNYSYLTGSEYGTVLRITTDAVVLTDAEFLRAARNAMRSYAASWNAEAATPTPSPVPTATASPLPVPTPYPTATAVPAPSGTPAVLPAGEPEEPKTHKGERLTLSFAGLPGEAVLETLREKGVETCFFLTAEELRADPDLVRRIIGSGHLVGLLCAAAPAEADAPEEQPEDRLRAELSEAAGLLFACARQRAMLFAAPDAAAETCRSAAAEEGMVWCPASNAEGGAGAYTAAMWLENTNLENPRLRVSLADGGQGLGRLLQYAEEQQYTLTHPWETD